MLVFNSLLQSVIFSSLKQYAELEFLVVSSLIYKNLFLFRVMRIILLFLLIPLAFSWVCNMISKHFCSAHLFFFLFHWWPKASKLVLDLPLPWKISPILISFTMVTILALSWFLIFFLALITTHGVDLCIWLSMPKINWVLWMALFLGHLLRIFSMVHGQDATVW